VLVGPAGERSFVADRGAADLLSPEDLRPAWLARVDLLHLPIYSLLPEPLGSAARRAAELVRAGGGQVTVDLASVGPIVQAGRRTTRSRLEAVHPDVLFTTVAEARALIAGAPMDELLTIAPVAVIKRGPHGVTLLARGGDPDSGRLRFDVATRPLDAEETTGAGDAFDAGFIVAWLRGRADGLRLATLLQRSAASGHRAAARQLTGPRAEITFE
jgi:sugar/nucleoside kinase (ribokinase family)